MSWEAGTELRALSMPPITREQLRAYADASGDHNPIHLDESFAREAGFPSVIVHGMISMAFLGELVSRNFPQDRYRLASFQSRFRKVTFPGDVLTCEGEVKKVLDDGALVISLRARNQRQEIATDGEATVYPLENT